MKTLGIIGGLSPESTVSYYTRLNSAAQARLGGLHSAKLLIASLDFGEMEAMQFAGDQAAVTDRLVAAARSLERAGADGLAIASNTKHECADAVADAVSIPLLHIADATAAAVQHANLETVGLLGTRFTMERDFYRKRLAEKFNVTALAPGPADRDVVHNIIFDELVLGRIADGSREKLLQIVDRLQASGAQGIILGCTELDLILQPRHVTLPLFDSTDLHVAVLADFLLQD